MSCSTTASHINVMRLVFSPCAAAERSKPSSISSISTDSSSELCYSATLTILAMTIISNLRKIVCVLLGSFSMSRKWSAEKTCFLSVASGKFWEKEAIEEVDCVSLTSSKLLPIRLGSILRARYTPGWSGKNMTREPVSSCEVEICGASCYSIIASERRDW